MISFKHIGDLKYTFNFLNRASSIEYQRILNFYGAQGVKALRAHTPVDTGKTRASWGYSINVSPRRCSITWTNSNANKSGTPIVILIQYGYGTRQGGYVYGRDIVNTALYPIFDGISQEVWREVQAL